MIVDTSSGTALSSSINGLTIVARGTVFIVSRATRGIGIQLTSPSEIRGVSSSTLNVGGSVGIMLSSSLSISAPKMQVAGDSYGIGGIVLGSTSRKTYPGSLSVKCQSTVVEVKGELGCIVNLSKLELTDGLSITSPSGASFTNNNVTASGSVVKGESVVIKNLDSTPHKKGDVNGNGTVDISDVVAAINQIAGIATYIYSDVNGDTKVDISDVVAIINIIANGGGEDPQDEADAAVKAGICPDNHHPHVIDFGENQKWSCCNVGAKAPWEHGDYYAWGELETKESYTWDNYTATSELADENNLLGSIRGGEKDVAFHKWSGLWNIPSENQTALLGDIANSDGGKEWIELNGVPGWKVKDSNGHAIFLPASGYYDQNGVHDVGIKDCYWTSDQSSNIYSQTGIPEKYPYAFVLPFDGEQFYQHSQILDYIRQRSYGLPVRLVINESIENGDMDISVINHICPDSHHPHEIDLGEGGIWQCCNLGASAPWEYGDYYAWGETICQKERYDWSTYSFCDGNQETIHNIGNDICGTVYDPVVSQLGASWELPSVSAANWLLEHCALDWLIMKGVGGLKITAPNGNSLFLPTAGQYEVDNVIYRYSETPTHCKGFYQLSIKSNLFNTFNLSLHFEGGGWPVGVSNTELCYGQTVRAVKKESTADPSIVAGICPDLNHPHSIDLGTGKVWYCYNIGASKPWEYGDFFAWGETATKESYDWSSYTHCDGTSSSCKDIGNDISGTDYDVARVKLGAPWRLPTQSDALQLIDGCTVEWTEVNGTTGSLLTGKNGNRLFLPQTPSFSGAFTRSNGSYWTSLNSSYYNSNAQCIQAGLSDDGTNIIKLGEEWRSKGLSVRAVK